MIHPNEEAISKRAYLIWEREGRPQGRDRDHWLQAAWELSGEEAKAAAVSKKAKPAAKSARKPAKPAKAAGKRSRSKSAK